MTSESTEERLCEDFVELGGVVGALELPGSGEGMLGIGSAGDRGRGVMRDCADFDHC